MKTVRFILRASVLEDFHRDERNLFIFFAVYLAAWTLFMAWLPSSMNLDDVEQVIWSRTW